jgi:hypothetical protein
LRKVANLSNNIDRIIYYLNSWKCPPFILEMMFWPSYWKLTKTKINVKKYMDYPIWMIKTYLSSFLESIHILSLAQKRTNRGCSFMLTTFCRLSMFIYSIYSLNNSYVSLLYIIGCIWKWKVDLKHTIFKNKKTQILMMKVEQQKCMESLM